MKEELEKELQILSPIFLSEMYGDVSKTAMHCGITCGDGWFFPLKDFCIKAHKLNLCLNGVAIVAKQIKEKFGEIRIYWDIENTDKPLYERDSADRDEYSEVVNQFRGYLEELCNELKHTCELCGKRQDTLKCTKGWIRYVCDECYEKVSK